MPKYITLKSEEKISFDYLTEREKIIYEVAEDEGETSVFYAGVAMAIILIGFFTLLGFAVFSTKH